MVKNRIRAPSGTQVGQIAFALLVLTCDYFAAPVVAVLSPGNAEIAGVLFASLIAAQLGLMATWVVFSSRRFLHRLGIGAAVGFASYGLLALGVVTANSMVDGDSLLELAAVILAFLFVCPLFFFAVQLPMWIARTWLRFEIAPPGQPSVGSYLLVTQISDLIMATAAAGVALASARMGADLFPEGPSSQALLMFVLWSGVGALGSLISLPPLIYFVLGTRTALAGCILILIWYGVVNAIPSTFLVVVGAPRGVILACFLFTGSATLNFCVGLLLTRMAGYRLRRRQNMQQPLPAEPKRDGSPHPASP